jgi:hypothetical protein
MVTYPIDRRKTHDLAYFINGGVERRRGRWDRRSNRDRRRLWKDRRVFSGPYYEGTERRSGTDRRSGDDRRRSQVQQSLQKNPDCETVSVQLEKSYLESRPEMISPGRKESRAMQADSQSVKFKIEPASYPSIKIYYEERQGNAMETEVSFPREFWIGLANTCKDVTGNMDVFSSKKIAAGLQFMSRAIMGEITAEEKRARNKEAYETFIDFVVEVNDRADLDKVRKGQLIHEEASRLQLQP